MISLFFPSNFDSYNFFPYQLLPAEVQLSKIIKIWYFFFLDFKKKIMHINIHFIMRIVYWFTAFQSTHMNSVHLITNTHTKNLKKYRLKLNNPYVFITKIISIYMILNQIYSIIFVKVLLLHTYRTDYIM